MPEGGMLRVEVNNSNFKELPDKIHMLDHNKADNRILAVALNLQQDEKNGPVVLVSKDLNLRIKADVLGIKDEDLTSDKVDFRQLYSGQAERWVGLGSKIVFTWDIQQIDHPYLDAAGNGLTILVERLKNEAISGHVTLIRGERSQVAELGAKLL